MPALRRSAWVIAMVVVTVVARGAPQARAEASASGAPAATPPAVTAPAAAPPAAAAGAAHDVPAQPSEGAPAGVEPHAVDAAEPPPPQFDAEGSYQAGAPIQSKQAVALAAVLAKPEQFADKPVRIEGTVMEVCTARGCWLMLQDGAATTRVTFKDYGFFVPRDAVGAHVVIEASVARESMPEAVAKHYAAETKGGDPAAIKGPQPVIAVVATGVELHKGATQAQPSH